jgi:SRSO17 transposase
LIPFTLFAQSYLISSIPLPKTYVQNLDGYECDEACLADLMEHEQVFSFLAHAQDRLETPELNEFRLIHVGLFNMGAIRQDNKLKIALLLPYRVIGRYANSTTNAVFAYMLTKNRDYEIKSYQIDNEAPETLHEALKTITNDGFYYVIAPVTKNGAQVITDYNPDLTVYFPTINKNDIGATSSTLFFGGIDYRAQIDALIDESVSPLAIFYDKSRLGKELHDYTKERYMTADEQNSTMSSDGVDDSPLFAEQMSEEVVTEEAIPKAAYSFAIDKHTSNLERQLKENEKIQNASFVLNTPIVKTGMIMSQLTLYDTNTTNILSTQINYDPLLFSITQYHDRKEMVIANSIGKNNNVLVEANRLLSNDIVYDWINYATTVGTDLFYNMITHSEREYKLPVVDNQIEYPITLVSPSYYRFVEYVAPEPPVVETDISENENGES